MPGCSPRPSPPVTHRLRGLGPRRPMLFVHARRWVARGTRGATTNAKPTSLRHPFLKSLRPVRADIPIWPPEIGDILHLDLRPSSSFDRRSVRASRVAVG